MHRYGLLGKLKAKNGRGVELAGVLLEAAGLTAAAPGCHAYLVGIDKQDADVIWVTEVWATKADHDASLQAENVRALIAKAIPLLDGNPEKGFELNVLGGHGV